MSLSITLQARFTESLSVQLFFLVHEMGKDDLERDGVGGG